VRAIIIGASGLIGTALYRVLRQNGVEVIGTRSSNAGAEEFLEFDLLKDELPQKIGDIGETDTVYLLSAYSDPGWIFHHQPEAEALNYTRTRDLIDAIRPRRSRLIFMSSVEVFDGTKGAYAEDDATHPLNFYGRLKERIERHLCDNCENFTIVRSGWNVGWDLASRCVVRLTYETLLRSGAKMAFDNEFSVVDVDDTAACLARLMDKTGIPRIHACSDDKVNRAWLARRIMEKSVNRDLKGFREVPFDEIAYTERRGRLNDLVNGLSKSRLDMRYRGTRDIIDAKVALLDGGLK